jgi:hypothetical protein
LVRRCCIPISQSCPSSVLQRLPTTGLCSWRTIRANFFVVVVLLAFLCAAELSELSLRFSPPVLCCCVHQCRAPAMGHVSKDVDSEKAQRERLEVNEMEHKSLYF